jgi:CRP/FNR family transcriptional regulator, cyclic AMP receptor protein
MKEADMLPDIDELRQFRIFEDLNERELEQVAKISKSEVLGPGARLTATGAAADRLYLLKNGKIEIRIPGQGPKEVPVDEIGPGDMIGWSTLTGPFVYTASCWTCEKSQVIEVNGARLRQLLEANNHIGYRVLKGVGYVISKRVAALQGTEM